MRRELQTGNFSAMQNFETWSCITICRAVAWDSLAELQILYHTWFDSYSILCPIFKTAFVFQFVGNETMFANFWP